MSGNTDTSVPKGRARRLATVLALLAVAAILATVSFLSCERGPRPADPQPEPFSGEVSVSYKAPGWNAAKDEGAIAILFTEEAWSKTSWKHGRDLPKENEGITVVHGVGLNPKEPVPIAEGLTEGTYWLCLIAPPLTDGTIYGPVAAIKIIFLCEDDTHDCAHSITVEGAFVPVAAEDMDDVAITKAYVSYPRLDKAASNEKMEAARPKPPTPQPPIEEEGEEGGEEGKEPEGPGEEPQEPYNPPPVWTEPPTTNPGNGSNGNSNGGGVVPPQPVWVPGWTEEIYHPAVYKDVWISAEGFYSSVCNDCGAILGPGEAGQHLLDTKHNSYRSGVWIETSPGRIETVTVSEAWTEYIEHPGYWL